MYYFESKKVIITNYWLDMLSNNTKEFINDVKTFPVYNRGLQDLTETYSLIKSNIRSKLSSSTYKLY